MYANIMSLEYGVIDFPICEWFIDKVTWEFIHYFFVIKALCVYCVWVSSSLFTLQFPAFAIPTNNDPFGLLLHNICCWFSIRFFFHLIFFRFVDLIFVVVVLKSHTNYFLCCCPKYLHTAIDFSICILFVEPDQFVNFIYRCMEHSYA